MICKSKRARVRKRNCKYGGERNSLREREREKLYFCPKKLISHAFHVHLTSNMVSKIKKDLQ